MEIKVWVDDWQMQCCGEPFTVGDQVSWTLRDPDVEWLETVLGADLARGVDKAEEHHGRVGENVAPTAGIVASLLARVGGPVTRLPQAYATNRYVNATRRLAAPTAEI